ncbi:MAG: metallophosphoesterase [Terriglobales bacterium]
MPIPEWGGLLPVSRRKFLQGAAAATVLGALAVGSDALVFEPNDPKVVRLEVSIKRMPEAFDGFTVAQLSDFHYGELCAIPIRKAVEIVKKLQPDMVVLTGDFITVPLWSHFLHDKSQPANDAEPCTRMLRELRPPAGMFAALGNHDVNSDGRWITEIIESNGIPVLRNRSIPIEKEGARFWLAGVDDVLEGKPDLDLTLHAVPSGEPVILLAHEPDFADQACRYPIDLQLSGHSHGGQIWLPVVGAPWLPPLGREYPRGLRKVGNLSLYTNIGLGTIRLPVRLNCPPEITLLTLRSA